MPPREHQLVRVVYIEGSRHDHLDCFVAPTSSELQQIGTRRANGWRASAYQVNSIRPGLRTTGSKKWLATIVASGQIGVKKVICQSYGTIFPTGPIPARIIMPAVIRIQNTKVNLNFRMSFGISEKKEVSSASFEVAPQDMSMENIWERIACDTWREIPPRKTVSRGTHLKFSMTVIVGVSHHVLMLPYAYNLQAPNRVRCSTLYRRMARATFPSAVKTIIMAK